MVSTHTKLFDEANKAKSEFPTNMGHELRPAMDRVLGFTPLLEFDSRS